ncbi:MAG: DUF348 domain-containing protein [Firmicutes bacterium]|nr:DUF348 domain-containing protein [Bacillota bacterium]
MGSLRIGAAVTAVALVGSAVAAGHATEVKAITLTVDGQRSTYYTAMDGTVGAFLQHQRISFGAHDRIYPAVGSELRSAMEIEVRHAVAVRLNDGGKVQTVYTTAADVAGLLAAQRVHLGNYDRLNNSPFEPIRPNMTVTILRGRREVQTKEVAISHRSLTKESAQLKKGEREVVQAGHDGLKRVTVTRFYENDRLASTQQKEVVVNHPTDEIVVIGTKEEPTPTQPIVASRGGQRPSQQPRVRVSTQTPRSSGRTLQMVATAYSGDGYTASGRRTARGLVAVDPDLIPLGTRLYISGYGEAIAADTGGAIQGRRIDLYFPSAAQAQSWGVRTVSVTILN